MLRKFAMRFHITVLYVRKRQHHFSALNDVEKNILCFSGNFCAPWDNLKSPEITLFSISGPTFVSSPENLVIVRLAGEMNFNAKTVNVL